MEEEVRLQSKSTHACNELKIRTHIVTHSTIIGSGRTSPVIDLSCYEIPKQQSYIRGRIHGLGCETIIQGKWQRLGHNSNEPTTAANCDHHTTPRSTALLRTHRTRRRLPVMALSQLDTAGPEMTLTHDWEAPASAVCAKLYLRAGCSVDD